MANKRLAPIRWTLEKAGYEFNIDHRALGKRVRRESLEVGDDGCFSTAQICAAVFGDKDAEDLRLTREQADAQEIKNRRSRFELLESETVYKFFEQYFIVIRQRILASSLTREDQDDLLREIQGIDYGNIRDGILASVRAGETAEVDSDSSAPSDVPGVG
jgi:hypothetical protein